MTLAHGTDRLESARLVLRRIAPDDLPFFTHIHALPEVAQYLYPGGRPRSPEESAAWLEATLASYVQLALGYLAVLRKEDGALIGRCGLMDLVVSNPRHPSTGLSCLAMRRSAPRGEFVHTSCTGRAAPDARSPRDRLRSQGLVWLRGLDLNQRPLGY